MQLHRNLSDRAAENNSALSSRLVRESSKGSFVIMIPFLLPFYHCAPLACTLTAVWKEQMTQRSGLRANGDLYLCMTCFVSPGVDRVRTCRWEERLSDTDAETRSATEQAKKMFVINSKRWRDRISLFLQTASLITVVATAEGHKCDWTHKWPRIHRGSKTIKDPTWDLNSILYILYVYVHRSG